MLTSIDEFYFEFDEGGWGVWKSVDFFGEFIFEFLQQQQISEGKIR